MVHPSRLSIRTPEYPGMATSERAGIDLRIPFVTTGALIAEELPVFRTPGVGLGWASALPLFTSMSWNSGFLDEDCAFTAVAANKRATRHANDCKEEFRKSKNFIFFRW